jgi:hypothetical protein
MVPPRRLHIGRGYRFKQGHRDPSRKLHYLGTVKNGVPYKNKPGRYKSARIFVCGTKDEIEQRRMVTIVEVPVRLTRGTDGKINAKPTQCNVLEYGNYSRLYHNGGDDRKAIAPIEKMLKNAGFKNRSVPPTPARAIVGY